MLSYLQNPLDYAWLQISQAFVSGSIQRSTSQSISIQVSPYDRKSVQQIQITSENIRTCDFNCPSANVYVNLLSWAGNTLQTGQADHIWKFVVAANDQDYEKTYTLNGNIVCLGTIDSVLLNCSSQMILHAIRQRACRQVLGFQHGLWSGAYRLPDPQIQACMAEPSLTEKHNQDNKSQKRTCHWQAYTS